MILNSNNIKKTIGILCFIMTVTLLMIEGAAKDKKLSCEVRQITTGPNHHFFGYIGHALTIPWNESNRYIVALRTDFYKRMPKIRERAEIVLIDTKENYKSELLDKTYAWNLQQGTMFYWNPNAPETQFFFNDLDPETGLVFTVLYDIKSRQRIREYRYDNESIANGGVAPGGEYFAGINYGKITRSREIISYAGAKDWTVDGSANPENDGLFKIDIATGERQLLVSYTRLAEFLQIKDPDYPIYVHHTLWNRNSDRIVFVVRGRGNEKYENKWPNVGCVVHSDGTGLGLIEFGGHPEWLEGNLLTLKECVYTFYRMADGAFVRSPVIPTKSDGSVTRIDGAPRWNRTSDAILVGGVAEDGTRQLLVIRLFDAKK